MNLSRRLKNEPDFRVDKIDKYKVQFVRMMSGVPTIVSTRRIKKFQTEVSIKRSSFAIDFNHPSYRKKNTYYYLFDIEKGQMFYGSIDSKIMAEIVHLVVTKSGIRQLVTSVEKKKMGDILLYVILSIIVGLMGGYILGNILPMIG